ncbi:MAG: hypothetical protein C0415_05425 [Thermodesulfovibrio sp.]|nr:hypothetical protein [Thermodesulfovibrio sp.]
MAAKLIFDKRKNIIPIGALIAVISLFLFLQATAGELKLTPKKRVAPVTETISSTEVGTGWSTKENLEEAVKEAIEMALKDKKDKTPDFAIIFASSGSDMKTILSQANKIFKTKTKIYGGTSDSRGVMTDKGFAKAAEKGYEYAKMEGKRSLAVMTVTSKDITFGVGSADFSGCPSIREASKTAVLNAIKSAGKSKNELPKAVLITPTLGTEEEVVEGIEMVVGKNTPILGGTAGGPALAVFGENKIYNKGVSLAVIYTGLPMGWVYEGGFDVKASLSGIVTKVKGQAIVEIDNRPALNVYNEWLGGEIDKLFKKYKRPDLIRDLLVLHPIYRKLASPDGKEYFLFSHPWPKDDNLIERSVMTSTKINVGERIYLGQGTWETLINRVGSLPQKAKTNGKIRADMKPVFSIGYICGGVMGIIPEMERLKLPYLINYANNNAPFIAPFTWGEQGNLRGVGNKHGNLLTSFLIISDKR